MMSSQTLPAIWPIPRKKFMGPITPDISTATGRKRKLRAVFWHFSLRHFCGSRRLHLLLNNQILWFLLLVLPRFCSKMIFICKEVYFLNVLNNWKTNEKHTSKYFIEYEVNLIQFFILICMKSKLLTFKYTFSM